MEKVYLWAGVAALGAGCLVRSVEEPTLSVRDARLLEDGRIRVLAFAYNPNPFPVAIRNAEIDFDIDGLPVGRSAERVAWTLPPRRPVVLLLVHPLELYDQATRTRSALGRSLARYRLRGRLDIGAQDRSFEVPFRHEGVLRGGRLALAY